MRFEWDDEKEEVNYKKHRIRFVEAVTIWSDENSIEFLDQNLWEEERYIRIGRSLKDKTLTAVFCERNGAETIRIISARVATIKEVMRYEKRIRLL